MALVSRATTQSVNAVVNKPQSATRLGQPNVSPVLNVATRRKTEERQRIAIAMASTFEPSVSASRQSMAAAAPSMAERLPSVDFGFDDLRARMAQFTAKFDAFIEQGRKRVLEERNQFRMAVAELQVRRPDWLPRSSLSPWAGIYLSLSGRESDGHY